MAELLKNGRFPGSAKYDPEWVLKGWMGPNVLWLTEWLCEKMELKPGMRVLDMGCGKALSSIFLAKGSDYLEENEYRFVIEDSESEYVYMPVESTIKCVVVGDRFNNIYVPSLKQQAKQLKIPCKRLYWYSGTAFLTDRLEV